MFSESSLRSKYFSCNLLLPFYASILTLIEATMIHQRPTIKSCSLRISLSFLRDVRRILPLPFGRRITPRACVARERSLSPTPARTIPLRSTRETAPREPYQIVELAEADQSRRVPSLSLPPGNRVIVRSLHLRRKLARCRCAARIKQIILRPAVAG